MSRSLDRELARLRRRALLATFLGEWSRHALVTGFVVGAGALIARAAFDVPAERAAWALVLLALTPLTAWLTSRRRYLSSKGAAAWLDLRAGATGLVLTEFEVADERWRERAQSLIGSRDTLPSVRFRAPLVRTAGGVAFALLALWVELPTAAALGPAPELYDSALEDLRTKLETLEEVVQLQEETRAEIDERLARLEAEAEETRSPEATFEALDQLDERMSELAERAEDAAEEMTEALDAAGGNEADPGARQEELERALEKLAEVGLAAKLDEAVSAKLAASLAPEAGTTIDLSEWSELSQEMREALEAKLAKLADAGLLKSGKLGKLGKLGEPGDLEQFAVHVCDENCKKPGGT
jgi:hypothetical protein